MAYTPLEVQKASFAGVYTLAGGVLVPNSLVWTEITNFNIPLYFDFVNKTGRTVIVANNETSEPVSIINEVNATIYNIPFPMGVSDSLTVVPPNSWWNIVGPFSNYFNFDDRARFIISPAGFPPPTGSLKLAVVCVPAEGG